MLILIVATDQNIVKVHQNKLVNIPMHNRIHQALEGTGGITQPQWQCHVLKQAIPSYKSSFLTIARCQTHLVIATRQINGTEARGSQQLIEKDIYPQ